MHRDIKPANLLLDADGTLKIGDLGIARFLDDPAAALTATGQIVGTSLYLAPERALGRTAGPASDVYSLGCVLYQLLTGRPPFQADSALAILHQHLDAPPTPPRELGVQLPPAFESYLLGLLAKEPEDRPTAQQVADWFTIGAWQGRPEPLPDAMPSALSRAVSVGESAGPVPGQVRPVGETGPATTYMLPSATPHTSAHSRRNNQQRPGIRALASRRPALVSAFAATVLFLAALLAGMTWFAPDNSSAETNPTSPSRTTSTDPASTAPTTPPAEPSPSPTPTGSLPSPSASVLSDDEGRNKDEDETAKPSEKKQDKQEHNRERPSEDDDD